MMKRLFMAVVAGAALLVAAPLYAAEEHRQLGAHMHGHGTLNMAIDGNKVAMELVAPGADIVGFENEASTDEQKAKVKAAIDMLEKDPETLFVLTGAAKCTYTAAKAEVEAPDHKEDHKDDHEDEHDDHDHVADDHEKEEAQDGSTHEDSSHDGSTHEEAGDHSEFHVVYELECAAPAALKDINILFFKQFPNSEELDVTIVDDRGSQSHEATRDNPIVTLEAQ